MKALAIRWLGAYGRGQSLAAAIGYEIANGKVGGRDLKGSGQEGHGRAHQAVQETLEGVSRGAGDGQGP